MEENTSLACVNNCSTTEPLVRGVDVMKLPWLRSIFILFYCVIFLLGVSGNSLVVFVVSRNRHMRTITNIFICNLAISDILMCLLAIPFTPMSYFMNTWTFGDAICKIVPMVSGVSVFVSTLTSIAIAVDRYFVIVHPFKPRMKVWLCLSLILAVWAIAITVSMPIAIYQQVKWEEKIQALECGEEWPRDSARQVFTVVTMILQYLVPCIIITFCYSNVSMALHERSRVKPGHKSREREELEIKRKRRTNRMLIAMVAIFVCCWMPLNIFHLIREYHVVSNTWPHQALVFFIAHVIAMSSTIYNPFLYAWMNENFRKEFKQVPPFVCLQSNLSGRNGCPTTTRDTTMSVLRQSPIRDGQLLTEAGDPEEKSDEKENGDVHNGDCELQCFVRDKAHHDSVNSEMEETDL
ncbi:prolactin-releasing peptide receptor [Lingula anatina]|uniref:Prolactin-releasing peptide receptor n=1 Tax=Lingula anatina TaxID=7574 RepID=A0A1S3K8W0_LINAN|nr:prolactin-releasing peptide receptor [Lingula anatina]XP_013419053.1 prolactin-releasing peptide receptor [Lingula anatina]XP_013419054.1 prolactin-releasing peptide receptor [Lingula anatina]XP_013419055.1 prolactin-releasing peptide receptor [Lingula anatina]XP_013419056.1 prolactin-releasing peptide receptor [Lingula anatina]XP_013419057.1 prolactin-releasing peptide receptor [Lingula anatina]XP_013419058.1 prolactin-releasing peptide receptor [Lingula anatina]XP_013419059.1 prolactin-|eukprot:XP_013419052.1 prolactin-releasing peptide receptor [Lingula anatina]